MGRECACGVLCGRVGDRREGGIGAQQGCVGWGVCLSGVWRARVRLGVRGRVHGGGGAADSLPVPLLRRACGPGFFLPHFCFLYVSRLPHKRCIWCILCISIDSWCIPKKFSHSYSTV